MTAASEPGSFEYPDTAGYPDGKGTLDEGTAALVDEVLQRDAQLLDEPSSEADVEVAVRRSDPERLYEATVDGRRIADLRFSREGDRLSLLTTTVVPEFRGRGIAAELVADALDDIRSRGERITVFCPVVSAYLTQHPEYADLQG